MELGNTPYTGQQLPPTKKNKLVYQLFTQAPVIGKRYYMHPDPQITEKNVTGIDGLFYSPTTLSFPATVSVDGQVFNVINFFDVRAAVVTLVSKDRSSESLIQSAAFIDFNRLLYAELKIYDLPIDWAKCFIQFRTVPAFTPYPMAIPFNIFQDDL